MDKPKNSPQLTALLQAVGKKLGMPPEQLRQELESGRFDKAIAGLSQKEAAAFQSVLANPQKLSQVMSSKQARALYEKLMRG